MQPWSIEGSLSICGDHGHIFSLPSHWYTQPLNKTWKRPPLNPVDARCRTAYLTYPLTNPQAPPFSHNPVSLLLTISLLCPFRIEKTYQEGLRDTEEREGQWLYVSPHPPSWCEIQRSYWSSLTAQSIYSVAVQWSSEPAQTPGLEFVILSNKIDTRKSGCAYTHIHTHCSRTGGLQ